MSPTFLFSQVAVREFIDSLQFAASGLLMFAAAGTLAGLVAWLTVRYIPHNYVGVVEKLWSRVGSVSEGSIIALNGEAGYQADLLRGGLHFGLWRWQYRIHKVPLVTIPQGKIGYVYARDGEPLPASQTLGPRRRVQQFSGRAGLPGKAGEVDGQMLRGQRGRQRAILREGVYAINPAAVCRDHRGRRSMHCGTSKIRASARR